MRARLRAVFQPAGAPPRIDVWYGSRQVFGAPGLAQRWINILGNARDPQGGLPEVAYSLNGGAAVPLLLGPDRRRLARRGDFNIELDAASLLDGENRLRITARGRRGGQSAAEVLVIIERQTWPLPYAIDWASVSDLQAAAQVVDGHWTWDARGARPLEAGYDRVLAIGDESWADYEASVEVTLHGIDPSGYQTRESGGAGFGVNLHWLGHTDDPYPSRWPAQPHMGWLPTGASNWYSFKKDGSATLAIEAEPPPGQTRIPHPRLAVGHTYVFKVRAESTPQGCRYAFKLWEKDVEPEPAAWRLERQAQAPNLGRGALLLVLHHVDATFGALRVTRV